MYPAAAGGEREAIVTPFAGSHEGRGRMPDPEFQKTGALGWAKAGLLSTHSLSTT